MARTRAIRRVLPRDGLDSRPGGLIHRRERLPDAGCRRGGIACRPQAPTGVRLPDLDAFHPCLLRPSPLVLCSHGQEDRDPEAYGCRRRYRNPGGGEPVHGRPPLSWQRRLRHSEAVEGTFQRKDGRQPDLRGQVPVLQGAGPHLGHIQRQFRLLSPQEHRRLFPGQAPALPGLDRPASDA